MRMRLATLASALGLFIAGSAMADRSSPDLAGTAPAEREAIEALCSTDHSAIAYQLCVSNQVLGLMRKARAPDLSVASPDQRQAIETACASEDIPADRFHCQREKLAAAGLPVHDDPHDGTLRVAAAATPSTAFGGPGLPHGEAIAPFPMYNLEQWRRERPPMRHAVEGPALSPTELYERIWRSVFVVTASDQPVELAERANRAIGSAVAISDHILLTNCHVIAGRPQVLITQQEKSARATIVYADPAGDSCFLRADSIMLHPVPGIRPSSELKVGETVFSLGTPTGLELSFGQGMVSGLRSLQGVHFVQNSAPSWHGSSGGGLFDARGNLVGVTTLGSAAAPNLNFAIAAEEFWP